MHVDVVCLVECLFSGVWSSPFCMSCHVMSGLAIFQADAGPLLSNPSSVSTLHSMFDLSRQPKLHGLPSRQVKSRRYEVHVSK